MKVKPMLGGYEIRGIQRIGAIEGRRLVKIPVPGLQGCYHQDLGTDAISIRIEGTLAGDQAREDFLNAVRDKFKAGDPVDFVADITTATEIDQVIISDLKVQEMAGSPDGFRYFITIAQYVEPPPPPAAPGLGFGDLTDLTEALDLEAGDLFDLMKLPNLLESIPDITNPLPPIEGILDGFQEVTKGLSDTLAPLIELYGKEGG